MKSKSGRPFQEDDPTWETDRIRRYLEENLPEGEAFDNVRFHVLGVVTKLENALGEHKDTIRQVRAILGIQGTFEPTLETLRAQLGDLEEIRRTLKVRPGETGAQALERIFLDADLRERVMNQPLVKLGAFIHQKLRSR